MNCYNCRIPLEPKDNHREHIPADNLFTGFPIEYKKNRITVHSCFTCNQSYSGADEEFRNLIGVINKNNEATELVKKTFRSINRVPEKRNRIIYDAMTKKPIAVKFDFSLIEKFHKKNFNGVFYHNYKYPLPENYRVVAHFDKDNSAETIQKLIKYVTQNFKWKVSGHENVFRYIIQPFRERYKFDGNDIIPNSQEKFFIAILSYTKNHATLVLAQRL